VRGLAQGPLYTADLPHRLRKWNCRTSRGAAQWVIVYVYGQPRQSDRIQRRQSTTGKATTQQRIQWGELTRVQMTHRRDEADESWGVPSSTHGQWVLWNRQTSYHEHRLALQVLATTGAILRRPCPCRASVTDARSENPSRLCGGNLVFPWSNTFFNLRVFIKE